MQKKGKKDPSDMRHGYTTGACSTAATKAALIALITGEVQEEATIHLPVGRDVTFSMEKCEINETAVTAETIKDAGDDPDATDKARIVSTVSWTDTPGVTLDGGTGVGRVTKPGLPVPVGEAAINPVPRRMILTTVQEVMEEFQIDRGVKVVISVPDGEEIAKKTLNGRLGIVGGISILGTRGIVVPFSSSAYMASIVQAISVAKSGGCDHLVLTTGGRSEKYAMGLFPFLPEEAFIEMGDFVGFSLKNCKKQGIKKVSLVGMMGKFSKVAQGVMMVHSKSAPVNFEFLANIARSVGASEELAAEVEGANTASQVGELMAQANHDEFFRQLCEACCRSAYHHIKGGVEIETAIYSMKGQLLGRAVGIDSIGETNRNRG
ncbi:cobalt-precorrin-5B (C(1))-methyltransferase [Bacillus thermotolerans]|uniref:Cobalt-precorrin-5B C(1)-methyltransferase n=1 Tax=Bacillus thermotolerans TaxID=1221996 RepID=A0A0F5HU49_BACTR|nr:cobalt-precorrin-5B (C(1))-methyltransferase [Bacillus thermotolerans]KKB36773.1 Cobalt-precorrin-6 synthase, anaerobic [Bacillus thermotolerans]KKB40564.1 Cobalt-precorrin-6 synthase, anaerobic [Bacillus thermotolerans]KKB43242.1 Cobalt-precorrin-6 synthase, anaerobic [Bacillus thermotolerans]